MYTAVEKAVYPTGSQDLWKQYWAVKKYSCLDQISPSFISLQTSESQQKHRAIQHAAGAAPVKLFILSAVTGKRKSQRARERERGREGRLLQTPCMKNNFYSSISKRQTRTHFVALKPETGLLTVKKGGMLVLQISDPCLAAKPKQIPFQAAHLRGSSLSPLLSRLKARDIWRRLLECKIQAFSVIGIRSASLFFLFFFYENENTSVVA